MKEQRRFDDIKRGGPRATANLIAINNSRIGRC